LIGEWIPSSEPGGSEEQLGIPVLKSIPSELSDWAPMTTSLVRFIIDGDRGSSQEKIESDRLGSGRLIGTDGAK
jgi:hypothetical protein